MNTVFTNGCFDILHAGHVRLLRWARGLGDKLIVGINSDASITRIKGDGRPIVPQAYRVAVLQELRCVDEVIVFDEITPLNLITQIRPTVLVKGPDYSGQRVSGQDFVESIGGRVYVPDWHVDISTSWIIKRICDDYDSRRSHD